MSGTVSGDPTGGTYPPGGATPPPTPAPTPAPPPDPWHPVRISDLAALTMVDIHLDTAHIDDPVHSLAPDDLVNFIGMLVGKIQEEQLRITREGVNIGQKRLDELHAKAMKEIETWTKKCAAAHHQSSWMHVMKFANKIVGMIGSMSNVSQEFGGPNLGLAHNLALAFSTLFEACGMSHADAEQYGELASGIIGTLIVPGAAIFVDPEFAGQLGEGAALTAGASHKDAAIAKLSFTLAAMVAQIVVMCLVGNEAGATTQVANGAQLAEGVAEGAEGAEGIAQGAEAAEGGAEVAEAAQGGAGAAEAADGGAGAAEGAGANAAVGEAGAPAFEGVEAAEGADAAEAVDGGEEAGDAEDANAVEGDAKKADEAGQEGARAGRIGRVSKVQVAKLAKYGAVIQVPLQLFSGAYSIVEGTQKLGSAKLQEEADRARADSKGTAALEQRAQYAITQDLDSIKRTMERRNETIGVVVDVMKQTAASLHRIDTGRGQTRV
jgi:hypothetical protein